MTKVDDVAVYILEKLGPMSAMKLQKLVYYSQAWHATWEGRELFSEPIEAWANGPVVRRLYNQHKGLFTVGTQDFSTGRSDVLQGDEIESINIVLDAYGDKSAQWLSDMTHSEPPWQKARGDLPQHIRSEAVIPLGTMVEYYSTLTV